MAIVLSSCKDGATLVPPDPPPVSRFFFQTLALGDTLLWDYRGGRSQSYTPYGYWNVGRKRWKVVAIDSSSDLRKTTIEAVFSGITAHQPCTYCWVWDTAKVDARTNYVEITEDANNTITINLPYESDEADRQFCCLTFNKYYPSLAGDTVKILGSLYSPWKIILVRGVGLVDFYAFEHGSSNYWQVEYALVQSRH